MVRVARQAAAAGADIIQYRDKASSTLDMVRTARLIKSAIRRFRCGFIVNDRIEVAIAADADGVHLGSGDPDRSIARAIERGFIIGISATTFGRAVDAINGGADYIGLGPIYPTPIKPGKTPLRPGILKKMKRLDGRVMLIGGITRDNAGYLVKTGFRNIAVIRAVSKARDPYRATKELKELLQR